MPSRLIATTALGILLLAAGIYSLYTPHYPSGGRCLMTIGGAAAAPTPIPGDDPDCRPRSDMEQAMNEAFLLVLLVGGGALTITGIAGLVMDDIRHRT